MKNGFITHLKLKGMMEKFDIKDQNIHLEFNVPTNFYELRENQKLELKVTNFSNLVSNPSISQTFGQKKLLGWTDIDIKANREFLRKDKELEWELQQILTGGPNWREQLAAPGTQPVAPEGGGAGAPPGAAPPPAFGGAAAGAGAEPAPVEGGAEAPATEPPAAGSPAST